MSIQNQPPPYDEVVIPKTDEDAHLLSNDAPPLPSTGPPFPPQPISSSSYRPKTQTYPSSGPQPNFSQPSGTTYIVPFKKQASGGYLSSNGFTTAAEFEDDDVRRNFIRKVYAILFVQLLVTFGIVCIFTFVDGVAETVKQYPGIYYAAYALFLGLYITLVCCGNIRRQSPLNLILLAVFTLSLSLLVGTIASFHSTRAVITALGITVIVCLSVSIFAMQTKFDFTKCWGLLFVLTMVLFLFGLVTIFTYKYSWYIQVIHGCLGALVFTLFLAFDTQMIMGGRRMEISPEEYVFGALSLYMDIVYIFIYILSLVGNQN